MTKEKYVEIYRVTPPKFQEEIDDGHGGGLSEFLYFAKFKISAPSHDI